MKVSIITVSYNAADTIEQTIQSVLGQSYPEIEYIVIDGYSTDGTQNIVRRYADRITYFISEPDNGLYDAMNKGIRLASGDIVGILNSDDYYNDDTVSKVAAYFAEHDVDVAYGNTLIFNRSGKNRLNRGRPLDTLWYQMAVPHAATFVKKSIYEIYGLFETNYKVSADYDLMLRLYRQGVRFGHIDETLAYFRWGGISIRESRIRVQEDIEISLKHLEKKWPGSCEEKKRIEDIIRKQYGKQKFLAELEGDETLLYRILRERFRDRLRDGVIIFGTGVWGHRCCERLLANGVKVKYFVDNDPNRWDTEIDGIKVLNPDMLRDMEGILLIAVMDHCAEIEGQLQTYHNEKLWWLGIDELVTEKWKTYTQPEES